MTKKELLVTLSEKLEIKQKEAEKFYDTLIGIIKDEIKDGSDMTLSGLGTFKIKERSSRVGRNPKTGEEIKIPAKKVVTFKVAKALNELV